LRLQITRFTVHTYVKQLHVKFDVASRGELLAVVYNQMLNASPAERPTTQAIEPTEEMSMPEATLATPPAASSTPAIPASSLRMAVLNKFPSFDPSWDAGCQRSWFRAYQMLLSVT
ncbi:MAG: hypothetical protein JWM57_1568, partial [Phycisphaerales bacterium]|nr:hypothetical protein [Phycisphaerales bacterium]